MNPRTVRRELQAYQRCWSPLALREVADAARRAVAGPPRGGSERLQQWCCWLAFGQVDAQDFARFAREQWVAWRQSSSSDRAQDCVEAFEEALWRVPPSQTGELWHQMAQALQEFLGREQDESWAMRVRVATLSSSFQPTELYRLLLSHQTHLRVRAQWLLWERLTHHRGDEEEFAAARERLLRQLDTGAASEWPRFVESQWEKYGRRTRAALLKSLLQPPREVAGADRDESRRWLVKFRCRLCTEIHDQAIWREALRIAYRIEDPCYAAEALGDCAVAAAFTGWGDPQALYRQAQLRLNHLQRSFDVVVQIHSLQAYRYVAHSLALVGAIEGSLEWIRKALRQAEAMGSGPTRARTVADCAAILERLNTEEAGLLLLRTLAWWQADSYSHQAVPQIAEALVSLGIRQGKPDWIQQALQAVRSLDSVHLCGGVARCAARLGEADPERGESMFEQAAQLAQQEIHHHLRAMALREVLPSWARTGRQLDREPWLRRALALAQQVPVPGVRSEILATVLQEWAYKRPTDELWLAEGEALKHHLVHPQHVLPTDCAFALARMILDPQQGRSRLQATWRRALTLRSSVEHRDRVVRACGRALLEAPLGMFAEWFPRFWQTLRPLRPAAPFLHLLAGPPHLQAENLEWPLEVLGATLQRMERRFLEEARGRESHRTRERLEGARWNSSA